MPVEITYSDRGFAQYGEPFITDLGHEIRVYESSSASKRAVWVALDDLFRVGDRIGNIHAYLTEDQARALRDRLNAFLGE